MNNADNKLKSGESALYQRDQRPKIIHKTLLLLGMDEKFVNRIGWFASFMAIVMYLSYVDQIRLNISGNPGSIFLPVFTTINCMAWTFYALLKVKKDWPLVICNVPGIILWIITAVTAIL